MVLVSASKILLFVDSVHQAVRVASKSTTKRGGGIGPETSEDEEEESANETFDDGASGDEGMYGEASGRVLGGNVCGAGSSRSGRQVRLPRRLLT